MAAKNYTEILELVNAGNQMGLSNTIKRDYGIPLDFTSVQASYDDAVVYAATNTKAYVGQPLSVGGKLYIINDVAADAKHKVGEVEYDNYLVEVGSATEGDGHSIDLEGGVLKLHGFESALAGELPQKKPVFKKDAEGNDTDEVDYYELDWVAISAIVQGDGNKVTTLTSEDGSVVITKKTDTDESLVYDLSVAHPDIPEYSITVDERADDDTATTYHLIKNETNTGVAIVVPDAYNDTALAGRVKAVEDNKANAADVYTKGEVDTAISDAVTSILGEDVDEAYNTLKEIQEILEGTDGEAIDGLIETAAANKQAIETLNGTGEGSVDKQITDAIAAHTEVADGKYATKQELTDHSNTMDGKLASYYTKTETDGLLNGKVDDVELENYYTKTETVAKTEVYTKGQIDQMLEDIEGGSTESAASVKRALDAYVQDTDTEIYGADLVTGWTAEDGTYTPEYLNSTSRIDTALANAATAQAQADKGVADAKAAAEAVEALANGQVATNKEDLDTVKGRLATLETAKGDHATRLGVAEGKITALEEEDVKINQALGTTSGQITALQGEDGRLGGLIAANTEAIGKKAAQADVDAINAKIGSVAENTTLIEMIGAKADQATTYTKTEVDNLLANLDQTEINEAIAANAAAIAALAGEGNTSTVKENADAIAAINALLNTVDSEDSITSLKELAIWLEAHETEVMPVLNAHDAILAGIGGEGEHSTVIEYVNNAIASIPDYTLPVATATTLGGVKSAVDTADKVAVNKVYISAEGVGEVKALSTDNLVQGTEELVLCGGNAGTATI